jgi:putative ATPase subunit gpP of terminase
MYPTNDPINPNPNSIDPTILTPTADLITANTTIPAFDPTTPMPATDPNTTTDITDTYTPIYSMPPSPAAEPFIPARSVPATADTPRDRAYTLHLQGYRSPAIAAHLHVPERTIRHWIQHTNQEINALPSPRRGRGRGRGPPLLPSPPSSTNAPLPSSATARAVPPPGRSTTSCAPPSTPSSPASANASCSTPNTPTTPTTSPCPP